MANYRKPLAAAVALNTVIFVVEGIAGLGSNSLSLLMDSVHNLSDELAVVFLCLAFILSFGVSRTGQTGGIVKVRPPPDYLRFSSRGAQRTLEGGGKCLRMTL